jgi:hypothetical protein
MYMLDDVIQARRGSTEAAAMGSAGAGRRALLLAMTAARPQ